MKNLKVMLLAFVISILMTAYVGAKDIMTFNHDELLSEYERSDDVYQKYINEKLPYRIMYKDYATGEVTYEYFNCDVSEYEDETVEKTKSAKKKSSKKKKKKVEVQNNVSSSIDNEKMEYLESIISQNDEEKNVGWVEFNGAWYYQDESGNNKSGWQYIIDKWYYFNPETCIMVTGLIEINGNKYYFDNDGALVRDDERIVDGTKCYFDTNGQMTLNKYYEKESNFVHIDLWKGIINYDGPKSIVGKDVDIELLDMNAYYFDLYNNEF